MDSKALFGQEKLIFYIDINELPWSDPTRAESRTLLSELARHGDVAVAYEAKQAVNRLENANG